MPQLLQRACIAGMLGLLTAIGMLVHGAREPQLILAAAGFVSGFVGLFWLPAEASAQEEH